jgi:hypothetical protein
MALARITPRRVAILTLRLAPVVLIVLIALALLQDYVPKSVQWKAALAFVLALEVAYGATLVLTLIGALVLGVVLCRRGRAARGPAVARGLLLCVSLIVGLLGAETASAVWLYRSHRQTPLPVWGRSHGPLSWLGNQDAPPRWDIELPTTFPDPKEKGEINLVVVGESSAQGIPYDEWVSIGRIICWQLKEALPARSPRVNTVAFWGQTLEKQHQALSGLTRRPDIILIYCGQNEITARLPFSRDIAYYLDEERPGAWTLLFTAMEAFSPMCGLIGETAANCRIAIPPPQDGNRAFVDTPAYTLAEYAPLLVDFRRRLNAIVSYAEQVGALPVLIAPPSNDAGFEPNRSFLPARTARLEREAFRRDFLAARRLEASDPQKSLEQYRALLARQPGFAETHYRLAQLLERAGAWDQAYEHYMTARDLDGYPMRMLTAFQNVYHDVAKRHGCILIDGQAYFHAIGRHGLLDENLFHDAMHPSLRGQIALAQAVLQALQARGAFGWPHDAAAPVIDPARCAARFGLVPAAWRKICLWGIMFYDKTAPMRYDSSLRGQKRAAFVAAADRIEAGDPAESVGLPNIGVPARVPLVPVARTGLDARSDAGRQTTATAN